MVFCITIAFLEFSQPGSHGARKLEDFKEGGGGVCK